MVFCFFYVTGPKLIQRILKVEAKMMKYIKNDYTIII